VGDVTWTEQGNKFKLHSISNILSVSVSGFHRRS
jgi:hypothetical protein